MIHSSSLTYSQILREYEASLEAEIEAPKETSPAQSQHKVIESPLPSMHEEQLPSVVIETPREPMIESAKLSPELEPPLSVEKNSYNPSTVINTQANLQELVIQVNEQCKNLDTRLETVQNSAQRTTTNATKLIKEVSANIPLNEDFVVQLKQELREAQKLKGENLFLVESLRATIKLVKPYIEAINKVNQELSNIQRISNTIESSKDLIFADFEAEANLILETCQSSFIISDSQASKQGLNELIKKINANKVLFDPLITKLKKAKKAFNSHLKRPIERNVHPAFQEITPLKTKEFKSLLKRNCEIIEKMELLLPTFDKTFNVIISQLLDTEKYIDKAQMHNWHFLQQFLESLDAEKLRNIYINGKSASEFLANIKLDLLVHQKYKKA